MVIWTVNVGQSGGFGGGCENGRVGLGKREIRDRAGVVVLLCYCVVWCMSLVLYGWLRSDHRPEIKPGLSENWMRLLGWKKAWKTEEKAAQEGRKKAEDGEKVSKLRQG